MLDHAYSYLELYIHQCIGRQAKACNQAPLSCDSSEDIIAAQSRNHPALYFVAGYILHKIKKDFTLKWDVESFEHIGEQFAPLENPSISQWTENISGGVVSPCKPECF